MRSAVRRRMAIPAAVVTGVLVSGLLVWHTSYAAFTAGTTNPANSFASGKVSITTSASGSALFNAPNLVPGSSGTQCVDVIYGGSIAATVSLSAAYDGSDPSSPLAQYLNFTIDEVGTAGNATDCANDALVTSIDPGDATLAAKVTTLGATPSTPNGWTPSTVNATKRYRFTYTLQDNVAAQNQTAKVGFTWTAKSTAGA